jgi:hypothetical protein
MKKILPLLTLAVVLTSSAAFAREDALPRGQDGRRDQQQKKVTPPTTVTPPAANPNRGKSPAPANRHRGGADDARPHH